MKYNFILKLVLAVLADWTNAFAQSKPGTTQWLYEQCTSPESARWDDCSAFLLGVGGIMEILGNMYENPPSGISKNFVAPYGPVGICATTPLTGGDVRQAFVNWAEKNPTKSSRKMPQSAMAALQAAWPCKMSN